MVAYPLIHGKLTSESYTDESAMDPRIDALRAKITCVEDQRFSVEYHEPSKRSIGNALTIELNDGTVLDEVEIEYPVGHKRRRAEGTPLLLEKFERHIKPHFDANQQQTYVSPLVLSRFDANIVLRILKIVNDAETLNKMPVDKFTDMFVKP